MNETGFSHKRKSNFWTWIQKIWTKSVEDYFHLKVSSCFGDDGIVISSIFFWRFRYKNVGCYRYKFYYVLNEQVKVYIRILVIKVFIIYDKIIWESKNKWWTYVIGEK